MEGQPSVRPTPQRCSDLVVPMALKTLLRWLVLFLLLFLFPMCLDELFTLLSRLASARFSSRARVWVPTELVCSICSYLPCGSPTGL